MPSMAVQGGVEASGGKHDSKFEFQTNLLPAHHGPCCTRNAWAIYRYIYRETIRCLNLQAEHNGKKRTRSSHRDRPRNQLHACQLGNKIRTFVPPRLHRHDADGSADSKQTKYESESMIQRFAESCSGACDNTSRACAPIAYALGLMTSLATWVAGTNVNYSSDSAPGPFNAQQLAEG